MRELETWELLDAAVRCAQRGEYGFAVANYMAWASRVLPS